MAEEKTIAVTFDDDKSVTIDKTRYVRSADLAKVAGSAETAKKDWETKEADYQAKLANTKMAENEQRQARLAAEAAYEQANTKYGDYDTIKGRATELETEIASHKEKVTTLEGEIANVLRSNLIARGAKEEDIKEKTVDQLRNLEEAAKIFGAKPHSAKYDGGNGAGGGSGSIPDGSPASIARAKAVEGFNLGTSKVISKN